MAWRVNPDDVEKIIRDYDTDINLAPFLNMANALVDHCASSDLSDAQMFEMERLLAAHFYDQRDHEVDSEHTEKGGGKHTGTYGMGLERTRHGQDAMVMDTTGCLRKVSKGVVKATAIWLGKSPSNQIDYVDRE